MNRYPRNMVGYGANAPDPGWPGGARIAVQMVLNYEEGGENCVLHGDAASEAFLSDIAGAAMWPGMRHWNRCRTGSSSAATSPAACCAA